MNKINEIINNIDTFKIVDLCPILSNNKPTNGQNIQAKRKGKATNNPTYISAIL